jgi:hypothetical protein
MNFLNPAFLLGLPLVAVPVVIHLLNRRQQKRIGWGAMRFLVAAATRQRRLWRLTDLLLLMLRTAALLFFILALARPLLPAAWLGSSLPREIILVVDQSLSTTRAFAGTSLFELQIQDAYRILGELNGSDTVRVLLAGESPEWLQLEPLPAAGSSLRRIREQLASLKPSHGAADLIAAVREAADLEAPRDKSARLIIVLSDGQRFGWRLDERPLWSGIETRLQRSGLPTSVHLQFVNAEAPTANLSVHEVATVRAFGTLNQSLTFAATVENHSTEPAAATLLSWSVDGQGAGVNSVPGLAPGASTVLSFNHLFTAPGTHEVTAQLDATDILAADNRGRVLVDIYDRLPVLLVEDPFSPEPLENSATFVLAALGAQRDRAEHEWRSVFEPTIVQSGEIESTDLRKYRCVVLADIREVTPSVISKLEDYVRNGGGLWLALGDQATNSVFNAQFHRGGLGVSPWKLGTAVGDRNDRERFFMVRTTTDAHPATALLSDFQRLDLDRVRLYRRHRFDRHGARDVSVLLQAEGGEPVVFERRFGRGRVLVQGMPLGVSWSTLPLCHAYVAMLHEWLWYLCEPNLPRRNLAVGEALQETAPDRESEAELTLPDGRRMDLSAADSADGTRFRFTGTRLPGAYTVTLKGADRTRHGAPFHVARNPGESDLKSLNDEDRSFLAGLQAFRVGGGLENPTDTGTGVAPRQPMEGWLLAVLPLVLLGEMAIAGWTTHQRNRRARPVVME